MESGKYRASFAIAWLDVHQAIRPGGIPAKDAEAQKQNDLLRHQAEEATKAAAEAERSVRIR